MSKDIIVLTPNGRRQKIQCTPDTSFLQVLEDVCHKQGFQASDYDLKHHNHILDLTTTIRFSNLPNKAMLEMVEAEKKRKESNVTIGLQLEDGERRTAEFPPTTTLYDLVISLAPLEIGSIQQPMILYMRQEVVGETALRDKTLRQLGLIKGRAILRLLNKQEEARQANVSTVYRKSVTETKVADTKTDMAMEEPRPEQPSISGATTGDSHTKHDKPHQPDILSKFKEDARQMNKAIEEKPMEQGESSSQEPEQKVIQEAMELDCDSSTTSVTAPTQENLERRLKIEEEVTFLGSQKAIAFMQPDSSEEVFEDLPDDFYELSIEEVRRLYHDLQQNRISLENTPLSTSTQREDKNKDVLEKKLNQYKNVVVRVQFPDHIILQGIFAPTNTIEDVTNFIKEHLQTPNKDFHIFTTPLKETLEPKMTLLEARFVPCVHMHFKWLQEDKTREPYLKQEIYAKKTAPDAASILASKYRAPSRRKQEDTNTSQKSDKPSTSKGSKVPRWFKN
ncbi:tether containing UBX domain for GLUT4 [Anticarsia gemmatalis]|uniref:tether containing UBX domain for GLUT4 n=1 Tax=Anticarsia gemmatalis TaxID=129554 RepID=UPI003F75A4BA